MSARNSNCPQCGAPVAFHFSIAVQTTCSYCQSILVRHDLDLEKVGQVADLPPNASPIQLWAEGIYRNQAFQVAGRIIYEYEQGSWNEWHLVFQNGSSGWLSDAMLEYAVSWLFPSPAPLPEAKDAQTGRPFQFDNTQFYVTTRTMARYRGVEGELPFEYWDKSAVLFADLRSTSRRFGTIDYSENPPLLFLGEFVEFDELALKNLRAFEGW